MSTTLRDSRATFVDEPAAAIEPDRACAAAPGGSRREAFVLHVGVRVEIGDALRVAGRAVLVCEVRSKVGDHVTCHVTCDLSALGGGAGEIVVPDLIGADVRVIAPALLATATAERTAGTDPGQAGTVEVPQDHLVFDGRVQQIRESSGAGGVRRLAITARSRSAALLGEVCAQQRYPNATLTSVAEALDVAVVGAGPEGEALTYVQRGESHWLFLAQLAAEHGAQLRAAWPRTADGESGDTIAEVARGFADVHHELTYGRNLLSYELSATPVNHTVSGGAYSVAGKRAHRFYSVRSDPPWLSGAGPHTDALSRRAHAVTDGGEPGVLPVLLRAPTFGAAQRQFALESQRRLGAAVTLTGRSGEPALRAGDQVLFLEATSAAPQWRLTPGAAGSYGLVEVLHRWVGGYYENSFTATPWAHYHPDPADMARHDVLGAAAPAVQAAVAGAVASALAPLADRQAPALGGLHVGFGARAGMGAVSGAYDADEAGSALARALTAAIGAALGAVQPTFGARAGGWGAPGGATAPLTIGLVVDNADPQRQGRVRVRFPWQEPQDAAGWARTASPSAGNHFGLGALPEVGAEVLVAFVGGGAEQPVVVGALWNGKDVAGHTPDVKEWVTRSGAALRMVDTAGGELAELQTPEGSCLVQLLHKGPDGVPLLTHHSRGHVSVEAPNGDVRITGKRIVLDATEDVVIRAGGALGAKAAGAVTVAGGGALALSGKGDVTVVAGGELRAHAGGAHVLTSAAVQLNPPGATAPRVQALSVPAAASVWAARPVPVIAAPMHTADRPLPRLSAVVREEEERRSWLAVRVVFGDAGAEEEPVAGAPVRVRLSDGSERAMTTNTQGEIHVPGLRPGRGEMTLLKAAWQVPPPDAAADHNPEGA